MALTDPVRETLAIMLQNHIATHGPLPNELGDDARAMLAGDEAAMLRTATALAAIEKAASS